MKGRGCLETPGWARGWATPLEATGAGAWGRAVAAGLAAALTAWAATEAAWGKAKAACVDQGNAEVRFSGWMRFRWMRDKDRGRCYQLLVSWQQRQRQLRHLTAGARGSAGGAAVARAAAFS